MRSEAMDRDAADLDAVRACLAAGDRDLALVTARTAWRGIAATPARAEYLRRLFVTARDARFERGVAFSLRELRKLEELSFGEARRMFAAFERMRRSALIDRYVGLLLRRPPTTRRPLRKALNLIWATGRSAALLVYIRDHAPKRLSDREIIEFYIARFVQFNDLARAAPLLDHLATSAPADADVRVRFAHALLASKDYPQAARQCAAAKDLGASGAAVAGVARDLFDGLYGAITGDASSAMAGDVRIALAQVAAIDPDNPRRREIERALGIVGLPTPRRHKTAAAVQEQPLATIEEAIALLAPLHPKNRPHKLVSNAAATLLRAVDHSGDIDALNRLLGLSPRLAEALAERFLTAAYAAAGVAVFRALSGDLAAPVWLQAVGLAAHATLPADVADFANRLATLPDVSVTDLRTVSRAFTAAQSADLDRFWLTAVANNRSDAVVPVALRSLHAIGSSTCFYPIARGVAAGTLRPGIATSAYIEAMRTVPARAWRWSDAGASDAEPATLDPALPPELALWTRAILAWARFDHGQARALLEEGHARWPDGAVISFAAERALLDARFGRYGALAADPADVPQSSDRVYAAIERARATIAAAPPAPDALYPQYLIDAIFDRVPTRAYAAVPHSVVTIVAALASGGSERQAVSVVEALSRDPRIATQSMLIRSVTPDRRAFFLPQVEASGVPFHVFEDDPADEAHVLAILDEPPGSPLSVALPLLPANLRVTICQLVPLLLARRPAVVHIRQDFVAAALACVLAGVPRCFIHRGSLTPDHWDLTVPQHIATIAPMRHVYRRLVGWLGFGFINNALSGVASDKHWTGCENAARFSLVHNIVDFARLGPSRDPDDTIRRAIGAGPGDLVVGAAFRFHRVKRPLLWLTAARHVLRTHPTARFLILGDGEMRDAMIAYAEAEGFADRLHLPGSMSDIAPWYRAMDVALLTSDREGLPNMLIEAQHFGVIPVSTEVGGAAETMDSGVTGVLIPADASPESIGDAVVAAFDDRIWFDRARAAAPDFVHARFGAKTTIDQIVALYGF